MRAPYASLARLYIRLIFLSHLQERVIYRALPRCIQHVLFVCKGNICRSPLAAAYVEARLKQWGHRGSVRSAGLETTDGHEAHPLAKAVAQAHGLLLQTHVTTPLTRKLVQQANLILVMEFAHRYRLLQAYPEAADKVFQLGHFHGAQPMEIGDPYGGTQEDFEACYAIICQSCDNLLRRFDWA